MKKQQTIQTERLILKPVTKADLGIYTKLFSCPKTTKYLPGGKPFSEEYIANYLSQKIDHWNKGYGTFIVCLRNEPNTKIGYAGVEATPDSGLNDIRYALAPEFHGKGYAFEAAKAALAFTFAHTKLTEVYGVAVTDNLPSARLLEKLGMSPTTVRLYDSDDLINMVLTKESL